MVLTNVITKINGVDLTRFVQKVEVGQSREKIESTGMGATSKEYEPGLADDAISITFKQSFAGTAVHATLLPLYTSGSAFPIQCIPNGTAVSAANPSCNGTFSLYDYSGINGGVGELSTMDVEFTNANPLGITWGTA